MRTGGLLLLGTFVAPACAIGGVALGWRAGQADAMQQMVGSDDTAGARTFAWRDAPGLDRFHGIYGQDLWLLQSVYPDLRDGCFVDVGSADGVGISNTKRLEDVSDRRASIASRTDERPQSC